MILAIVGPTGVGKTRMSVELASVIMGLLLIVMRCRFIKV